MRRHLALRLPASFRPTLPSRFFSPWRMRRTVLLWRCGLSGSASTWPAIDGDGSSFDEDEAGKASALEARRSAGRVELSSIGDGCRAVRRRRVRGERLRRRRGWEAR